MDVAAFNEEVRKYLRKVNLNIAKLMNQSLLPLGVTHTQMMVIFNLDHHGRMNISELSERMEMPKSNISAICSRLEESGLVTRIRDQADARIVYIELTPNAKDLTRRAKTIVDREHDRLAERLSEQERNKVLEGLSLLVHMYDKTP